MSDTEFIDIVLYYSTIKMILIILDIVLMYYYIYYSIARHCIIVLLYLLFYCLTLYYYSNACFNNLIILMLYIVLLYYYIHYSNARHFLSVSLSWTHQVVYDSFLLPYRVRFLLWSWGWISDELYNLECSAPVFMILKGEGRFLLNQKNVNPNKSMLAKGRS